MMTSQNFRSQGKSVFKIVQLGACMAWVKGLSGEALVTLSDLGPPLIMRSLISDLPSRAEKQEKAERMRSSYRSQVLTTACVSQP